jgi:hypothetical protein
MVTSSAAEGKAMRRYQSLIVLVAGIALGGCNRPAGGPPPAAASVPGATTGLPAALAGARVTPTDFFNYCCGDVVSIGFPTEFLAAGPGGSSINFQWGGEPGGTVKVEHSGTRRSTPAEAEAMMRKLHAGLRRAAQEKGCQVEGAPETATGQAAAGFTFKYSRQNNTGEVVVTRTERTEKEYQDKDGKAVYTIKVVVSEIVGKPPG